MPFVLPGLIVIGLFLVAVWAIFFRSVVGHEATIRAARKREADFERLLQTPGEPLYCVSCDKPFVGPAEAFGCPYCQIRAFVLPVRASNDARVIERSRQFMSDYTAQRQQAVEQDAVSPRMVQEAAHPESAGGEEAATDATVTQSESPSAQVIRPR